jgi:hypothetical protein
MRNDSDTKATVMHVYEQHKHERGVTAHSGLAHLAQLTTIYMRGLLGAKQSFYLKSGS